MGGMKIIVTWVPPGLHMTYNLLYQSHLLDVNAEQ